MSWQKENSEVSNQVAFALFRKLAGCTVFITGASRGIGKAIALKAAKDGANIVIAAKTTQKHPKLLGTIYTAAEESECDNCHAWAVLTVVSVQNLLQSLV